MDFEFSMKPNGSLFVDWNVSASLVMVPMHRPGKPQYQITFYLSEIGTDLFGPFFGGLPNGVVKWEVAAVNDFGELVPVI